MRRPDYSQDDDDLKRTFADDNSQRFGIDGDPTKGEQTMDVVTKQ